MLNRKHRCEAPRVLILGGGGRIGRSVASDLARHYSQANVVLTGRRAVTAGALPRNASYQPLDLGNSEALRAAITASDLVVHCAGPFHHRDGRVIATCIDCGVDYLDVSDHRSFHHRAIALHARAQAAGVTAILHTGIFPGISNSLVRLACDRLDTPERIHLSYAVGGTGGAGLTVMRTTFLGLQNPFQVWQNGSWQSVRPYSDREEVVFPEPVGKVGVYWFDVPEAFTFPKTWPVQSVTTKFGSFPDIYNRLTATTARFPRAILANPFCIEILARLGFASAKLTDRFSGTGVAMRACVTGEKDGNHLQIIATLQHPDTAIAAGCGTGSVAQAILMGHLTCPGVHTVEAAVPSSTFAASMAARKIAIELELMALGNS